MSKRCKHENADHLKPGDEWADMDGDFIEVVLVEQFRCCDCGAWLSLGPSDETDERVAIEIRAAEIATNAARGVGLGGHRPNHCTGEHCWHWHERDDSGPCCYCGDDVGLFTTCDVGLLAREIVTHEEMP